MAISLHAGWLLMAALAMPSGGVAQQSRPVTLTLAAGPSVYDLSGTGTSFAGAALVAWEPVTTLVFEPAVTFFTYSTQFDDRFTYLFPELSIQVQLPRGQVRPFLGVGAGGAFVLNGSGETVATLHAVGGVRVRVNSEWGLRGELRVRAVRPWSGNTADFLFGVSRRLR